MTIAHLTRFLKNPVQAYFRHRLEVRFEELPETVADEETFDFDGLETWQLVDGLVAHYIEYSDLEPTLQALTDRLVRAGRLPMAALGGRTRNELVDAASPMLRAWRTQQAALPNALGPLPLHHASEIGVFEDWLDGLRSPDESGSARTSLVLTTSKLLAKTHGLRAEPFIGAWVRSLAAATCGQPTAAIVVGRDADVALPALLEEVARPAWDALLEAWREGMSAPLPLACGAGVAVLRDPNTAADAYRGKEFKRGDVAEACLARTYPDFASLSRDGRFAHWAARLYGPLLDWLASAIATPHEPNAREATGVSASEPAEILA